MEQKQTVTVVLLCYHCGNKTRMDQIAHYDKKDVLLYWGSFEIQFYSEWNLYLCPVCNNVTLVKKSKNTETLDPETSKMIEDESILYPSISIEDSPIPAKVKQSFEAALRVKNTEGTLCAIGIRRTLETMCKDQGASGKDLYNKLKDLSDKGILPPIVNEMASVLRELGNEAAHGDDREFSDEIIDSMIKFTHVILDYVYNLPEKLAGIQNHLRKTVEGSTDLHVSVTVRAMGEVVTPQDAE